MINKRSKNYDVILLMCPPSGIEGPPLGLAYISTYLRTNGFIPKVIDISIKLYHEANNEMKKRWDTNKRKYWVDKNLKDAFQTFNKEINNFIDEIVKEKTDLVAFSTTIANMQFSFEFAKLIKKKCNKKIIFGGPGVCLIQERNLFVNKNPGVVDIFVIGEGEKILVNIIKKLYDKIPLKKVEGISYLDNGKYVETKIKGELETINEIPFPTYEEFDLDDYTSPSLSIIASRGCLYRCAFCITKVFRKNYLFRPPEKIVEEIEYHIQKNKRNSFVFNDVLLNGDVEKLEKLCDLIIKKHLNIGWGADVIARKEMTYSIFKKMKQAGCVNLIFGIESGSDNVLQKMRKAFTSSVAEKNLEDSRKAGIKNLIHIIVGFPGETEEDVKQTINFLHKNKKNISGVVSVNVCFILHDSELEKNPSKFGIKNSLNNIFPMNGNHYDEWFDDLGNNPIIRNKRVDIIIKELKKLNIPIMETNKCCVQKCQEKEVTSDANKETTTCTNEKTKRIDVLLINPPPWDVSKPPIGLGYLESYLKRKQVNVDVLDLNIELFQILPNNDRNLWQDKNDKFWRKEYFEVVFKKIKDDLKKIIINKYASVNPEISALSVCDPKESITIEIIKEIKRICPTTKIIIGGPSAYMKETREQFKPIYNLISAFVVGEGEETIVEIVNKIKQENTIKNIPGTIIIEENKEKESQPREHLVIDEVGFPKYTSFPMDKYTTKTIALMWTRGCIGKCTFCKAIALWPKLKVKNPQLVVDEINYHYNNNKIRYFCFWDSAVNSDEKRLEELCDLLIQKHMNIKWECMCIAKKDLTLPILKKMKKSGCEKIIFGIESGSNNVLGHMRKMFTSKIASEVLENTKKAGIQTNVNFIVGFPGETEKEFQETINFVKKNKRNIDFVEGVQTFQFVIGTEIFNNREKYDVTFPKENSHNQWFIKRNNTYKIRYDRLKRLIEEIKKNNIPIGHSRIEKQIKKQNIQEKDVFKMINYIPKEDKLLVDINNNKYSSDILLINVPPWGSRELPMAIGYITEFLEQKGINVKILDLNVILYHNTPDNMKWIWNINNKSLWQDKESSTRIIALFRNIIDENVKDIIDSKIPIIGFSAVDSKEEITIELIKKIKEKKPKTHIIIGGPSALISEERYAFKSIYSLISAFVVGEGEETILDIIKRVKEGKTIADTPGTITIIKGNEQKNKPKKEMDKEKIVFPTYRQFDFDYYDKVIPLNWSRGCVNKCIFCIEKNFWKSYRFREPKKCLEEIKYHVKRGYNEFLVYDSIINGDIKNLDQLLDLIIKNKLKIKWRAHVVAFNNLTFELFKKIRMAGCVELFFGIESGSDKILKIMKKNINSNQASEILKMCKKARIQTNVNFIVGFPGETEKEFQKTINFIIENKDYIDKIGGVATLQIVAGTYLEKNMEEFGIKRKMENIGNMWVSKDNNFEIRKKRAQKIIQLIKELGIDYTRANTLEDTKEDNKKKTKILVEEFNNNKLQDEKREKEKIIIVICPPWDTIAPPLGISYLSSSLRNQGYQTRIINMNIDLYHLVESDEKTHWDMSYYTEWTEFNFHKHIFEKYNSYIQKTLQEIKREKPLLICFSINAGNYYFTLEMIKKIREMIRENKLNTKIGIGGPNCDNEHFWSLEIRHFIDFELVGEGDYAIVEIVNRIKENQNLEGIPGVIVPYKRNFIPQKSINHLNKLSPPTFLEYDLTKYTKALPILGSRGCIGRCIFCNDWKQRTLYTFRKAEEIVDEIKMHIKNHGVTTFNFWDLVLNGNPHELERFCDLIIKENIKINWNGQGIINSRMKFELFKKMNQAGCTSMVYGVESCSDKVLKGMKKYFMKKDIKTVLLRTKKAGIKARINIITGFPGEGEKEFMETYNFIKENHSLIDGISSLTPCLIVGNSELQLNAKKLGITLLGTDWWLKWYSKDNNYEIRKERAKRIVKLANQLGIECGLVNIYDERKKGTKKIRKNSPIKLFFECLKENGLSYTINHTKIYMKKWIEK